MTIKTIISDRQFGVGQAALDAAIKFNFPYISDDQIHESIEQNVIISDGTVIISKGKLTGTPSNVKCFQKNTKSLACISI